MEDVSINIPIPENQTSNTITLPSFSVTVSEINPETFAGFDFMPESTNVTGIADTAKPPVSLMLPGNFLQDIKIPTSMNTSNNETVLPRISNTIYQTDTLFTRRNESKFVVGSIIASATLSLGSQIVRVRDLEPPLVLVFVKREDVINGTNITCNFWNFAADGERKSA